MDLRERQIIAIVVAGLKWSDEASDPSARLESVMTAQSLLRRSTPDVPERPIDFVGLLERPIEDWFPTDDLTGAVLVDGAFAPWARELLEELDENSQLEREQAVVPSVREELRGRSDFADSYRRYRRFLVENPIATLDAWLVELDGIPAHFHGHYVVPDFDQIFPDETLRPCPRCGYPMRRAGSHVACAASTCRSEGRAIFTWTGADLAVLAGAEPKPPRELRDWHVLKRGLWRFTLLPGLLELALFERFNGQAGLSATLWPDGDSYDLRVETDVREWRLDVKEWSSPRMLERHLRDVGRENIIYVLPDRQRNHLAALRERLPSIRVEDAEGVVRTIFSEARS
jgi:hypothetical protein